MRLVDCSLEENFQHVFLYLDCQNKENMETRSCWRVSVINLYQKYIRYHWNSLEAMINRQFSHEKTDRLLKLRERGNKNLLEGFRYKFISKIDKISLEWSRSNA